MKNTIGNSIALTLFGESHGAEIGATVSGLAPGIDVNTEFISHQLSLRRPSGNISTARVEEDEYRIISGVKRGKTTGAPLTVIIPNTKQYPGDYDEILRTPRPGHADYTAECKYHGYEDLSGGGQFSGRLTAPIVAVGAILIDALAKKGIYIGTHIRSVAGVSDRDFDTDKLTEEIKALGDMPFAVLDADAGERMKQEIRNAGIDGDSVGGVLECAVAGLPSGLGEPWFDSMESVIAHAMFSIPGIKGVEFGAGFGISAMRGSDANDAFEYSGERIVTATNNNGGINGGITNGMPVIFRVAAKPTPSISRAQNTVDVTERRNTVMEIRGRHDPAIVHRARVVVDSLTATVLADMLALRYGTDWLSE